jgi:hypothetical protein
MIRTIGFAKCYHFHIDLAYVESNDGNKQADEDGKNDIEELLYLHDD